MNFPTKRSISSYLTLAISAILIGLVSPYPTYVPNSPDVCSKMIPGHGPRPQTSPSPYQILLNKQAVTGGNNLQITIRGKKGRTFKGFYVQVRDIDGIPIGTFLSPDANESGVHGCFNQKNNAIHHKNRNEKDTITVYWKAPEDFVGQVRVLGTILKDFETYWTNVQAADLVTVSNISPSTFIASPPFPEKAEEESSKNSKTYRILNYNPYSPFSPLSSWDRNSSSVSASASSSSFEPLLSQPSERSALAIDIEQRQLLGPASFDFHGGLYASQVPALKSKGYHHHPHHHPQPHYHNQIAPPPPPPPQHSGPASINEQLPPLPFHKQGLGPIKPEVKDELPSYLPRKPFVDNPYNFYFPSPHNDISKPQVHFTPTPTKQEGYPIQPQYSQSVYDKNGHYLINHHYVTPSFTPVHHPPPQIQPYPHKPASDPSYPNSGYFPKDILTKLTSNLYNAFTNNRLFNLNIDNSLEGIWKPSKGILPGPHHTQHSFASASAAASSPPKVEMPKYGYLVYNPTRGTPYYVIPAMNEDEFVANHMQGR